LYEEEALMQKPQFDYYRGTEADQYAFYRIPKTLFTAECFKGLSCEAKVLYGLLLDRMSLSVKNRWLDEENRVYIIFTVKEVMELMGCGKQKAVKCLAELDTEKGIGLIEKKRLGLGKPNVIYVKNFMVEETENPQKARRAARGQERSQEYENHTSRSAENGFQEVLEPASQKFEKRSSKSMKNALLEVRESESNDTDFNEPDVSETEWSHTDLSETEWDSSDPAPSHPIPLDASSAPAAMPDPMDRMEECRDMIREQISYASFLEGGRHQMDGVDELVDLMVEVITLPDDSVMCVNTHKVGNIKAYLLTTLYNAPLTMSNYYAAEVNHDLREGG
jgi:hypothetical protein